MSETTQRTQNAIFAAQSESLRGFLQTASVLLQSGEDEKGIDALLSAVSELEKLVENDQNSPQPRIDLETLLPVAGSLLYYMKSKDMAGISDLLADVIIPMADEWMRGGERI